MLKLRFTMRQPSATGPVMTQRSPQAGGCLLFLAILVGLAVGLSKGMTGPGLIYGAIAGTILAVGYYLFDRYRRDRS